MNSHRYMLGTAAIGAAVALVLVFSEPGTASSPVVAEMSSFTVEAGPTPSINEGVKDKIMERQVRVIHPSPYQNVSLPGIAPGER